MYGWIQYQKAITRNEVRELMVSQLPEDALVILTFTIDEAKNLEWEHAKEFEYDGQMYDVVETKHHDNLVTYVCWPDEKESFLNTQLNQLAQEASQNNRDQKEGNRQLLTFIKSLFVSASEPTILNAIVLIKNNFPHYSSNFDSIRLDIDSPPPRHS
jgi:hypothetical protein